MIKLVENTGDKSFVRFWSATWCMVVLERPDLFFFNQAPWIKPPQTKSLQVCCQIV